MGICNGDRCCRDYELIRTFENNHILTNGNINNINEKIILKNGKSIDSSQLILSKKYFQIINEIRENPSDYINESKAHNLFEIFIKLKPSKPLKYSENNIFDIISYLEESQKKTSTIEKEKEIQSLINNGNIKNICLFQSITLCNDEKENFWYFLEENEDDIDKILTVNYDYITIICLSIQNDKSQISFILYDVSN